MEEMKPVVFKLIMKIMEWTLIWYRELKRNSR